MIPEDIRFIDYIDVLPRKPMSEAEKEKMRAFAKAIREAGKNVEIILAKYPYRKGNT